MIYWITILIIVFTTYIAFIQTRYGTLKSISKSYYRLKEDGLGMLFYFFCLALAIPLFGIYSETQDRVWVVAAFGAVLCGSASAFSMKYTKAAHYAGAVLLMSMSLLGIGISFGLWWPLAFAPTPIWMVTAMLKRNKFWWVEIAMTVIIIVGLLKAIL